MDPSRTRPLTRLDAEIAKEELRQRSREKPAPPSRGEGLEATSFLQRTVEQAEKQAARRKALIEATLAVYDHKLQQDCSCRGQKPRAARRKCHIEAKRRTSGCRSGWLRCDGTTQRLLSEKSPHSCRLQ